MDTGNRPLAGYSCDATDARSDRFFGDHAAQTDLARAGEVRSTAEFLAELAHRDHADDVGVFLTEQRHRPSGLGLFDLHVVDRDRGRLDDAFVDDLFDVLEFISGHRCSMREVEPQLIIVDFGSALGGVVADDAMQSVMQDVRGGVSPANPGPAIGIDHRLNLLADVEGARLEDATMHE